MPMGCDVTRWTPPGKDRLDELSPTLSPLAPGSFVHLPAGMPHYAWAEVETIVQINGTGPFDVTYIDPKDDPRRQ